MPDFVFSGAHERRAPAEQRLSQTRQRPMNNQPPKPPTFAGSNLPMGALLNEVTCLWPGFADLITIHHLLKDESLKWQLWSDIPTWDTLTRVFLSRFPDEIKEELNTAVLSITNQPEDLDTSFVLQTPPPTDEDVPGSRSILEKLLEMRCFQRRRLDLLSSTWRRST